MEEGFTVSRNYEIISIDRQKVSFYKGTNWQFWTEKHHIHHSFHIHKVLLYIKPPPKMSIERVKDCKGEDIHEDDYVATRYRGGTREGVVRTHRYHAVIIHT